MSEEKEQAPSSPTMGRPIWAIKWPDSKSSLAVRTGSVLRVILTGPRALHEPIASMQKTGENTYVLRPMHKHDIYGIELYAGDTIEIVDTPNTSIGHRADEKKS